MASDKFQYMLSKFTQNTFSIFGETKRINKDIDGIFVMAV